MKISENGIDLIKKFEGCKLTSYDDGTGIWTIGYGHTSGVKKGQTITQKQAEIFLLLDLESSEQCVNNVVKVSVNQNQFDSLVSFTFNCGNSALSTSTLLKKLNSGDFVGASNEFGKWCKDGSGNIMVGLQKRRQAEKELFNTSYATLNFTVKTLQNILNVNGYLDSDGNKLVEDGILGKRTLQALPYLYYGMNNDIIKWVQGVLNITVDGIFGNDTLVAVKKIQMQNNLDIDGIIGGDTWAVLCREV